MNCPKWPETSPEILIDIGETIDRPPIVPETNCFPRVMPRESHRMVYETLNQMSIVEGAPKLDPGVQMDLLVPIHRLRPLQIDIVMAQQV